MHTGTPWSIEEAQAWLRNYAWGADVLRQLQEARNAEQRQQWLCVVVAMRAVMERRGAVSARAVVDDEADDPDPAGIAAMAAHLEN